MKKLMTIAASLFVAVSAFAQVSVGAGFLNNGKKIGDDKGSLNGFYVGASYDVALGATGLTLSPGLYYNYAAAKDGDYYKYTNAKWKEHSLNIPVRLGYKIDAGGVIIMPYAGPVATIGLSSKITTAAGDIDMYNDLSDYYKRFDLKLGLGVAADFANVIRVSAGYDFGLTNIFKDADPKWRNNVFHIGVAYLF